MCKCVCVCVCFNVCVIVFERTKGLGFSLVFA